MVISLMDTIFDKLILRLNFSVEWKRIRKSKRKQKVKRQYHKVQISKIWLIVSQRKEQEEIDISKNIAGDTRCLKCLSGMKYCIAQAHSCVQKLFVHDNFTAVYAGLTQLHLMTSYFFYSSIYRMFSLGFPEQQSNGQQGLKPLPTQEHLGNPIPDCRW